MDRLDFTPVVIIGAARSGTNMLRDALTNLDGFATWACDEINPIWRHGNRDWPNDEIPPGKATGPVKRFIRKAFVRLWKEHGKPGYVVEKTTANSLRVPFVAEVLPEARFIHIVRDGVDVVASAQKRWRGDFELPSVRYYWAKIKYAPLSDLPAYGWSFLRNRISLAVTKDKRMEVWGPRFDGMERMADAPLDEVCARQWTACVESTGDALSALPSERVLVIHYETVTADPVGALSDIVRFLDAPHDEAAIGEAVAAISRRSVGKGRQSLSGDVDRLLDIMRNALVRYGYKA